MKLYHGSNVAVVTPDIRHTRVNSGKDFGNGFYLSDNFRMARSFAQKVVRRAGKGVATVSSYDIRLDTLTTCALRVLVFHNATPEWFIFVYKNRTGVSFVNDYDLVIGPVADNGIPEHIAEYERLKISGGDIDLHTFAKRLKYGAFSKAYQYCFRSRESLNLLKYLQENEK